MTTELAYRNSSIAGASPIGLVIVLFDTLVGDLRRAAIAIRKNDIGARCKELNHAALVLGRLESWIDLQNGGESARNISFFYATIRAKMIEAAAAKSEALLNVQIESILLVRSAWQQLDTSPSKNAEEPAGIEEQPMNTAYLPGSLETPDRVALSLSA